MVKQKILILSMLAVLVVGLAAMSYFGVFGSLNVLGEEGYQSYDRLLIGGTYDKNLWIQTINCVGSYGERETACKANLPYAGVSASSGSLIVKPIGGGPKELVRTADLRLKDFKFTAVISSYKEGLGRIDTSRGTIWSFSGRSTKITSPTVSSVGVELIWDDYELGHYQLKVNGNVVQEGTVKEGEEFWIGAVPYQPWGGDEGWASVSFENPRYKYLFSCDPQAGEVKVNTCFAGPAVIQKTDLKGLKSFCTALPATFSNAGVIASSKQVYYSLAKDQPVVIQANQVWEFQYLADGSKVGFPVNGTGVVDLCKRNIEIADLNDIPIQAPAVTNQQLLWTSNGRFDGGSVGFKTKNVNLLSGKEVFMQTEPVSIDEVLCPYVVEWSKYPGISPTCISISAFGQKFSEGDSKKINPFVNVKLKSIVAQYRLDDANKIYRWAGIWQIDFEKNAVQIKQEPSGLSIVNNLPSPVTVIVLAEHDIGSIDQNIVDTQEIVVQAGQTKSIVVPLHTEYSGKNQLTLTPVIQTVGGGISQESTRFEYESASVTPQQTPVDSTTTTTVTQTDNAYPWYEKFWNWLKSLFEVSS